MNISAMSFVSFHVDEILFYVQMQTRPDQPLPHYNTVVLISREGVKPYAVKAFNLTADSYFMRYTIPGVLYDYGKGRIRMMSFIPETPD
jgi:hypothetical protein